MCASDVTFWEVTVLLVELTFKTSLMEFPVVSRFEWKSLQDVFKGQKKVTLLPFTGPTLKQCLDLPTLNFYFVYYSIQNNTTEKLYLNILTFINRNIISVSTWLIWATTQLRVRMNVRFTGSRSMLMYSLYESVIVLLSLSFISSTELWTDTWVQDWLFGSPVKID